MYIHPQAICESNQIGEGTRIWAFAHIMSGACIARVATSAMEHSSNRRSLGDRVTVKNQVMIWDGVHIEDDVFIGPGVIFTNDRHPRSPRMPRVRHRYEKPENWRQETRIRSGASIGDWGDPASRCNGLRICPRRRRRPGDKGRAAAPRRDRQPGPHRRMGLPVRRLLECGVDLFPVRGALSGSREHTLSDRVTMYKNRKILAMAPAYNEVGKIEHVVARTPRDIVDCLLVLDDGSTDDTARVAREGGAEVLSLGRVVGVGAALPTGLAYAAEKGYDIAVIMAGNNKDNPAEIPQLLDPICEEDCDLVIGSRFLKGGGYGGDMPRYRKLATRLHPWLMSFITRKHLTETTNGFRAIRLSCLRDPRHQPRSAMAQRLRTGNLPTV